MTKQLVLTNDLTDQQKQDLSNKIEALMTKYQRFARNGSEYNYGVVDGLNNAYKVINEIFDDYCLFEGGAEEYVPPSMLEEIKND